MAAKGKLRLKLEDFLLTAPIGEAIKLWEKIVNEGRELEYGFYLADLIRKILAAQTLPNEYRDIFDKLLKPDHQVGATLLGGLASTAGSGIINGFLAPIFTLLNYAINEQVHAARLDVGSALTLLDRYPGLKDEIYRDLHQLGFDDRRIRLMDMASDPLLPADLAVRGGFRYEANFQQYRAILSQYGFDDTTIGQIFDLSRPRPQVGDVVTFADRQIYNQALMAKFQHDAQLSQEVFQDARKLGYADSDIVKHWRSHWQSLGMSTVFEMLHRLRPGTGLHTFTRDDMMDYLKLQPIAPYWHDKLIDISYNPLTRVDIRRMRSVGILDYNQVYNAYLDEGYSEKNAKLIADWVEKEYGLDHTSLSLGKLLEGFRKGIINEAELRTELTDLGYNAKEINFYLAIENYNEQEELAQDTINYVKVLYIAGQIDRTKAYTELANINLPAGQIDKLFTVWDLGRKTKVSLPSETDLEKLYKRGIIGKNTFEQQLREKGYSDERIRWTITLADQEQQEVALANAEKARREATRLSTSGATNQFEIKKAQIDVDIAQDQLDMISLKIAIGDIEDDDTIVLYNDAIEAIKIDIKQKNLDKANLRLQFNQEKARLSGNE